MKVAIYTRVSSDRQVQEGFSLEAQYDRLLEYIKMNGWDLVRVYTDPGISGKNLKDRPGVQELLNDAKQEKFDAVLIHKLDRLTRNIGDLHGLIEFFNKKNIKLMSFSENIDTSTPSGRMFIYFLGVFAQMYRENLSEEVTKGLTKRAEKGLRVNFKPTYGYDVDSHQLYINEEQAEIVKFIYDSYLKGMGKRKIAETLNNRNESSNFGIWYDRTIDYILRNITYTGKHHYTPKGDESKTIIKDGDHEAIISEDQFQDVQKLLKRKFNNEVSRSSHEYPFSTIIKCGVCGNPYHGKNVEGPTNGKTYKFYRCYGKMHKNVCKQSDISELILEKLLFKQVLPRLTVKTKEENFMTVNSEKKSNDKDKARKNIEREIAKSEPRKKNWQYAFGDGKLPYDDFVRLMDEELNRVNELTKQLEELGPDTEEVEISYEIFLEWLNQLNTVWGDMEANDKKLAIQSMFKHMTVTKTDKVWSMEVEFYK